MTTRVSLNMYPATAAFAENRFKKFFLLKWVGNDQFRRCLTLPEILSEERMKNLRIRVTFRLGGKIVPLTEAAAASNRNDLYRDTVAQPGQCNDVQVTVARRDKLACLHLFEVVDLITILGCVFILLQTGGLFHTANQTCDHFLTLTTQKKQGIVHLPCIIGDAYLAHARRSTAFDLVLQTRPGSMAEVTVLAVSQ